MGRLRAFEYFVMALVFGVVICFCIELSLIRNTTAGDVFKGYLPSSAIFESNGYIIPCFPPAFKRILTGCLGYTLAAAF